MKSIKLTILICTFLTAIFPLHDFASGTVLTTDTVWSGRVKVQDDVLVPEGVSLTVSAGTVVNIEPSDTTKTDPEYLSSFVEITVRGRLVIEGTAKSPVLFRLKRGEEGKRWAGLIIDGGSVVIKHGTIENAVTAIYAFKGSASLSDTVLRNNRYGIIAHGKKTTVRISRTVVTDNEYGIFEIESPSFRYIKSRVEKNRTRDIYLFNSSRKYTRGVKNWRKSVASKKRRDACSSENDLVPQLNINEVPEVNRRYDDAVLLHNTIWRGRIEINGLIRVPEGAKLIILPGTVVEFRKRDSNGDGIGENGILMQGVLIAKGTADNPIVFRSAESRKNMGDWDAVNIMNSDGARNLVEYCRIEDAYRGLHFHYANVMVNSSSLSNNYRAIQFQESSVEIRNSIIKANRSGIKARDSEVVFKGNSIVGNIEGANFFRTILSAENNIIVSNLNEGMKIREGSTVVRKNQLSCNRFGLMISDSYFGEFSENEVLNNIEAGVSVRNSDNLDLNGNFIQGTGMNGINVLSARGHIRGNHISNNGDRGIGIKSFAGLITENVIEGNGMYAIENESVSDILAPMNWWGDRVIDHVLYDKKDDKSRGSIYYAPALTDHVLYKWPFDEVRNNITWSGGIYISRPVTVAEKKTLRIKPGSKIVFADKTGMRVNSGRIIAKGKENARITFTAKEKSEESLWDEILLEHATGSVFSYCDFEYATWALHSHFTNLKVTESQFIKNDGGIRFRSGPIEISRSIFTENRIGMRAFMANAVIKENTVFGNETGIFVREKGGGLKIRDNNIYSNESYNIRVGDFNVEDVDARNNWWGTENVADTILDGRVEEGVGKVVFDPYLLSPLPLIEEEEDEEGDGNEDKQTDTR